MPDALRENWSLRGTWGFRSIRALENHFMWHEDDESGGFSSVDEYGESALNFRCAEKTDDILQCDRNSGEVIRYHRVTQEFMVISPAGFITTYYKKNPRKSAWRENASYFKRQCP